MSKHDLNEIMNMLEFYFNDSITQIKNSSDKIKEIANKNENSHDIVLLQVTIAQSLIYLSNIDMYTRLIENTIKNIKEYINETK